MAFPRCIKKEACFIGLMGDFWTGEVTTFQRLVSGPAGRLAVGLGKGSGARRVTLLLPCHARELGTEALAGVLSALRGVSWLHRIVIGLDQAGEGEATWLRERCEGLAEVLWLDGPEWKGRVGALPFEIPPSGKGRNVWLSMGYILEDAETEVIAMHDCDIEAYDPELLARLVYPVARREYGMEFSKGYYARFSDRLHGRLTRLLFQPLVQVLRGRFPEEERWSFLREFRYPLAGEVAMTAEVARRLAVHAGWGLETAMLAEVHALLPARAVCQVDLCDRYDHRHQPLEAGLGEPAREIAQVLLSMAQPWPGDFEIVAEYTKQAEAAKAYGQGLAAFNGMNSALADENAAVALFTAAIRQVSQAQRAPGPLLPAWKNVTLW